MMPKDQLRDAQGGTPALGVGVSWGMDDTTSASVWLTLEARAASPVPWCCGCCSGSSITLSLEVQELKWHERRYLLLHLNTRLCHPCRALQAAQHPPALGSPPPRGVGGSTPVPGAAFQGADLSFACVAPSPPQRPWDMAGPRCPVPQLGHRQWKKAPRVTAALWRRKWRMEKKKRVLCGQNGSSSGELK